MRERGGMMSDWRNASMTRGVTRSVDGEGGEGRRRDGGERGRRRKRGRSRKRGSGGRRRRMMNESSLVDRRCVRDREVGGDGVGERGRERNV